ncbi:MAG TPA: aminotransferase class I/II-fold pyridoxal phosphate-dependent enzyme [Rhodospirillaceae bacterium]|nr:aminotransferase class I/II-fold pyridoxal phosphate-dependent enzyme [Rhodospirillaceae bacterium]
MALKTAERGKVPPFMVMDVMRAAARREAGGADVLHLEVGQPSTGAPAAVIKAAQAALADDLLGYTLALGQEPLRQRIARHYWDEYQCRVDPESVVVTTGSSAGFILAFLAAFEPGDRVAIASPGYPAYRNILTALGIEPVLLPVGPASHFQPTAELLAALPRPVDGVIIASPSNPTGSMVTGQSLDCLLRWCREQEVRLISDEIYHGLTYGIPASTAAVDKGVVVVNSFSKYFSMTGWRLGWMVVPPELLRSIECLAQNLFISPPTLSQKAALAAFDCHQELGRNLARYAENRAILLAELPAAGFGEMAPSDGAFYLYCDISRWSDDSEIFCRRMLEETGVAATPGIDFDPLGGRNYLRFCFAGATSDITEAVRRLKLWSK